MVHHSLAAPEVGVVIPTHNRPQMLRRAIDSVLEQDYEGSIEVVVSFDRAEVDRSLELDRPGRRVRTMPNIRTGGLAGNRNTGILALDTELIAFCDDDDAWYPEKLRAQVGVMERHREVDFVTTAMRVVDSSGNQTVRRAGTDRVHVRDLARSRMAMLHSSSFLFRRTSMTSAGGFGLVDESIPRSMAEDWDLLLRAARQRPIAHVDEPLIEVTWGATSYFSDVWLDKLAANEWLLDHHPEMREDRAALGLMLAKQAFGNAALGRRRQALRAAAAAGRANWREPRSILAMLVVAGVPAERVVAVLNRHGRSI
jgi:glycosyltransferase involved in cell wall biosynthesis